MLTVILQKDMVNVCGPLWGCWELVSNTRTWVLSSSGQPRNMRAQLRVAIFSRLSPTLGCPPHCSPSLKRSLQVPEAVAEPLPHPVGLLVHFLLWEPEPQLLMMGSVCVLGK